MSVQEKRKKEHTFRPDLQWNSADEDTPCRNAENQTGSLPLWKPDILCNWSRKNPFTECAAEDNIFTLRVYIYVYVYKLQLD